MEETTGTGFNNIAGGIGSIIGALAGSNGIGDELSAITGKGIPQNVTYVQPPQSSSPSLIWILMGGALIVVMVLVFKK